MHDVQIRRRAQLSDDIQHCSIRTRVPKMRHIMRDSTYINQYERLPLNLRAVWKDDGRNVPHVMKVRTASQVCSFHLFLLIVTMVHTTETVQENKRKCDDRTQKK